MKSKTERRIYFIDCTSAFIKSDTEVFQRELNLREREREAYQRTHRTQLCLQIRDLSVVKSFYIKMRFCKIKRFIVERIA